MTPENLKTRTVYCHDNLDVLRGINSNSIDLIYLDPPFNRRQVFKAKVDSKSEGSSFSDYFGEMNTKQEC